MKLSTAQKVLTNYLQNFDFLGKVIFRRKNICGILTENYVLCSFGLKNDPIFRICAIRIDLRKNYGFYPISNQNKKKQKDINNLTDKTIQCVKRYDLKIKICPKNF
jgi:hypothetical protein